MAAGNLNLLIEQGATFSRVLRWRTADSVAITFTGKSVRMQARVAKRDTQIILSLSSVNPPGGIMINNDGSATITISAADTQMLIPGTYVYDLEVDDNGTVTRLLEGNIMVSGEVTR